MRYNIPKLITWICIYEQLDQFPNSSLRGRELLKTVKHKG